MTKIEYGAFARTIENALNEAQDKFNFSLAVQEGAYRYQPEQGRVYHPNKPIISGTLVTQPSALVPIRGYDNYELTCNLSILAPKPFAQEIYELLVAYVTEFKGTSFNVGHYTARLNFDMPTAGNPAIRSGAGDSLEIQTFVYGILIGNGVVGNDIRIALDGEPLYFFTLGLGNTAGLDSANIGNGEFVKSVKESQTFGMNIKVPYTNTPKIKELVGDMLNGNLDKTFDLTYSDGVAATEEAPFGTVITASNVNLSAEPGGMVILDIQFTLAFRTGGGNNNGKGIRS